MVNASAIAARVMPILALMRQSLELERSRSCVQIASMVWTPLGALEEYCRRAAEII